MAGNRKRAASTTISKKASGAKKRLLALIAQDPGNDLSRLVPNDHGTEAGFRDVRTAEQKGELVRWVACEIIDTNLFRQTPTSLVASSPC